MHDAGDSLASQASRRGMSSFLLGRFTGLGLAVAVAALALDQASKRWLLASFDLDTMRPVRLAPGLDLVLVRNYGISYGLFQQDTALGRWILVAVTVIAI